MAWFAFYQKEGGEEDWSRILAESRQKIIQTKQPQFITALDVDNAFEKELSAEELARLHYRGPLYIDFDSLDIGEAIHQFQKFLGKLEDNFSFDLTQAALYATGGKGFHVVIPEACWLPKPKSHGIAFLPYIFREMMLDERLFVDTLDLRVYTGKRGRMFRVANVKRKNGKFKVPITLDEARSMTEAAYAELVAAPRPLVEPTAPTLNDDLAVLYQMATDKYDKLLKNRKKSKVDERLVKQFEGKMPPTVVGIMDGSVVNHDVGFHKIALQLALTAHALGQSEDQLLAQCAGLIETHQGDGDRYNTPAKRRRELARMWHVMHENPAYQFSAGGVKSVVKPEVATPDLDCGGIEIEEEEEADAELDNSLLQGIRVTTQGIFKSSDDGLVKICAMGLSGPRQLLDLKTNEVVGYEVKVYMNGKLVGPRVMDMATFTSRSKFLAFTLAAVGASMSASDMHVGVIADILRARADRSGDKLHTVISEGLDVIVRPDAEIDVIWADRFGVRSKLGAQYVLAGAMTAEAEYDTDLAMATDLVDDEDTREFFNHLFNVNTPEIVAKMFAWYLMCYFSQPVRHLFNQFPNLQVYGQAGSGKSKTSELFSWMHYFRKRPKIQSAVSITPFSLEAFASGSASIPLVLDEYKPRQMKKDRVDRLQGMLRDNYTASEMTKGRVTSENGASKLVLKSSRNAAPMSTIGEAAELQAAIMERSVFAPFSKESKRGRSDSFDYCLMNHEVLASFGKLAMEMALQVNLKKLGNTLMKNRKAILDEIGERAMDSDRPLFNGAVILTGLDIGESLLAHVFGEGAYRAEFTRMRDAVTAMPDKLVPRQMSELARVIDAMAYQSTMDDYDEKNVLFLGKDYVITPSGDLELKMRSAWDKFVRYQRTLGAEVYFDSWEAFMHGCLSSGALKDRVSKHSMLKENLSVAVFTFAAGWLEREGVAQFKL